jgi:hypothetical protein
MDDVASPTYIAAVILPVASREEARERQKKGLNRGRKEVKRKKKGTTYSPI